MEPGGETVRLPLATGSGSVFPGGRLLPLYQQGWGSEVEPRIRSPPSDLRVKVKTEVPAAGGKAVSLSLKKGIREGTP